MSDQTSDGKMRRRYGMSRRDLLRRGAIVGGTLVWTIPVVKTISSADVVGTSPRFTCCECRTGGTAGQEKCSGASSGCSISYGGESDNPADCAAFCLGQGKSFCFHASPTPLNCAGNDCSDGSGDHSP